MCCVAGTCIALYQSISVILSFSLLLVNTEWVLPFWGGKRKEKKKRVSVKNKARGFSLVFYSGGGVVGSLGFFICLFAFLLLLLFCCCSVLGGFLYVLLCFLNGQKGTTDLFSL